MAMLTECQTPGAQYHTRVTSKTVTVKVEFRKKIALSKREAELLEANLHNAVEQVLARYYVSGA